MDHHNQEQILVLGAGVSGLSTAILLLKAGFQVQIWAKDFSPNITSDIAAAIWYPYLCEPKDKAVVWGSYTLEYLREHVIPDPTSGCRDEKFFYLSDKPLDEPWWKDCIAYEHASPDELPPGYVDAYKIMSVLTDPSIYLGWLLDQFKKLGGQIEQKAISSIDEAFAEFDTVVNCTGLGSRELFGDEEIYPVRGQVVKVKPNGLDYGMVDEEGPNALTYIVPRFNEIVLGGTAQKNNWNLEADPTDTAGILERAKRLSPMFENVEIVSVAVGLRPARSSVRLKVQDMDNGKRVVHNYGHGGAGFTLSWGCAKNAVDLVKGLVHGQSS